MAALRCSLCNTDWPTGTAYKNCPFCDDKTWYCTETESLTYAEATQLVDTHKAELEGHADNERKMDAAFDGWFLRQLDIKPLDELATRYNSMMSLLEQL